MVFAFSRVEQLAELRKELVGVWKNMLAFYLPIERQAVDYNCVGMSITYLVVGRMSHDALCWATFSL